MSHSVFRVFAGMTLLAISTVCMASTMNITASFSPSYEYPENNRFTDTTPQSGFCATWPDLCGNTIKSLSTGLKLNPSKGLTPQDNKRDSLFFKWPSSFRDVPVTNTITGKTNIVKFRVSSFSGKYHANGDIATYDWVGGGAFSIYPQGGCNSLSLGWLGGTYWVAWLWGIPAGNAGCYNITTVERPVGGAKYIYEVNELSFGYELITPDPLQMQSGIYTGSLTLNVGPGGDIDFGDNYQSSDSEVIINFTLSVNHELKLTTSPDSQSVLLQPCAPDRICSTDEGVANWERWMVTRIPPSLTGRSNFSLTSSGRFSVYLACEQQIGTDCALKSDSTSQLVPVQALLTLSDNVVDAATGSSVTKRRLKVGGDISQNIFDTKTYMQNGNGNIYFMVDKKNVETMLKTRPDVYRGAVTVIFDANIF